MVPGQCTRGNGATLVHMADGWLRMDMGWRVGENRWPHGGRERKNRRLPPMAAVRFFLFAI